MQQYFEQFRKNIIGIDTFIKSPFGKRQKIIYADWIASGRNDANHKEWSQLYTFDNTFSNLTHKNCELDLEVKQHIHNAITGLV